VGKPLTRLYSDDWLMRLFNFRLRQAIRRSNSLTSLVIGMRRSGKLREANCDRAIQDLLQSLGVRSPAMPDLAIYAIAAR